MKPFGENSLKTVVQDSIVRLGFRDGPESAIAEGFRRVSKCFTGRHGGHEAKARSHTSRAAEFLTIWCLWRLRATYPNMPGINGDPDGYTQRHKVEEDKQARSFVRFMSFTIALILRGAREGERERERDESGTERDRGAMFYGF